MICVYLALYIYLLHLQEFDSVCKKPRGNNIINRLLQDL